MVIRALFLALSLRRADKNDCRETKSKHGPW